MKNNRSAVVSPGRNRIIRDAFVGIAFSLSVGFITAAILMVFVLGLSQ